VLDLADSVAGSCEQGNKLLPDSINGEDFIENMGDYQLNSLCGNCQ
jgi:hypothetical protein